MQSQISPGDRRMYSRAGYSLLGGLWMSMGVMTLGLVVGAIEHGKVATQVLPLDRLGSGLAQGTPPAILDTGILILFATPLVGVLVALAEFILERDRPFMAITGLLLVILLAGFAVALH